MTRKLLGVAAFLPVVAIALLSALHAAPVNRDVAYHLLLARWTLEGRTPYVDWKGTAPPMMDYVHLPPALLASLTGLDLPDAFHLAVVALLLGVMGAVLTLPDLDRIGVGPGMRSLLAGVLAFHSLGLIGQLEFGQREHLFVLALVPWLLVRVCRFAGSGPRAGWALAVGAVLAPLALMKPHFLLTMACVELAMVVSTRRLRPLWAAPEIWLLVGAGVAYAAHFLLFTPEMRRAFFEELVPIVADNYGYYSLTGDLTPQQRLLEVNVALGSAVVWGVRFARPPEWRVTFDAFAAASAASIASYWLQNMGYPYHRIPADALLLVGGAFAVAHIVAGLAQERVALLHGAMAAVFALGTGQFTAKTLRLHDELWLGVRGLTDVLQRYLEPGDGFVILNTSVDPQFPAMLYVDGVWASRWQLFYTLPFGYRGLTADPAGRFPYHVEGELTDLERQFREELREDVIRYRPRVLLIPARFERVRGAPPGFQIEPHLLATGTLQAALPGYRRAEEFVRDVPFSDDLEVWAVWAREGG